MQEQLDGSNENEPEDAKGPRQDNGVGAHTRWERDSCDVEPQTCNGDDRQDADQDDPWGKPSRLDRAAPTELDQENEGKDGTGHRAGKRPEHCVRDMKEVKKCGSQGKGSDQKAAFNVEAYEAKVPVRELASQRAPQGNNDCRKTDKRQREGRKAKEVVGFCRCHDRILIDSYFLLA